MMYLLIFSLVFTSLILIRRVSDFRISNLAIKPKQFRSFKIKQKSDHLNADWLEELAAKLQSGAPARDALANSLTNKQLVNVKNACQNGGSISMALKADLPKDEIARALSSCWDIAEEAGIGLSTTINQLARGMQTKSQLKKELEAALTQAKLSVWILAALPLFGLFLASLVAENPLYWLFTNRVGNLVLIFGILMELLGIFWISRITNKVKKEL